MEIKGKSKASRNIKKEEELKRRVLVGKRGGNSTPSQKWRYGLAHIDGTLVQDPSFLSTPLSVRKLGSILWEIQQPHLLVKMNKAEPRFNYSKDKGFLLPSPPDQAADDSSRHVAALKKQHNQSIAKNGDSIMFDSLEGCSSSMEISPCRHALHPKGRSGNAAYHFKTSTELLRVLNRIWSLEEQHASQISLVKSLKRELCRSKIQIKELQEEKIYKKERNGMEKLQIPEDSQSFFNAKIELERERKARTMLEDLCDEFAKEIKKYEIEVRSLKSKSRKDQMFEDPNDKLILHISEAWLDERMQMKAVEGSDNSDNETILGKLGSEIEEFLKSKKSVNGRRNHVRLLNQENKGAPRNEIVGECSNSGLHKQEEITESNPTMKKCQSERLPELPVFCSPNMQSKDKIYEVKESKGLEGRKSKHVSTRRSLFNGLIRSHTLSRGCKPNENEDKHTEQSFDRYNGPENLVEEKWASEETGHERPAEKPHASKDRLLKAKLPHAMKRG
ncbi:unnamed protein product [Cuscuta epithymum]|uniref:Uncharacterized protein n=1 Tax=Cuscuta epithymum TaxID=186058 RepID=A0AAV0EIP8_9ASTE|nr:unnamed protein product [Cuscuta epithymum]